MTTVAFKDGIMACDSMISSAYIEDIEYKKIFFINGDIVGAAGNLVDISQYINWYKNERKGLDDFSGKDLDLDSLESIIYSNGKIYYCDEKCIAVPMNGNCIAIGSGAPYSMGAMTAGLNAADSVDVACKLDFNTGGKIFYTNCEKVTEGSDPKRLKVYGSKRTKKAKTS